jgi:hypothetical protein
MNSVWPDLAKHLAPSSQGLEIKTVALIIRILIFFGFVHFCSRFVSSIYLYSVMFSPFLAATVSILERKLICLCFIFIFFYCFFFFLIISFLRGFNLDVFVLSRSLRFFSVALDRIVSVEQRVVCVLV